MFRVQFLRCDEGASIFVVREDILETEDSGSALDFIVDEPWPLGAIAFRLLDERGREIFPPPR